jgi:hypothetical protein
MAYTERYVDGKRICTPAHHPTLLELIPDGDTSCPEWAGTLEELQAANADSPLTDDEIARLKVHGKVWIGGGAAQLWLLRYVPY